MYEKITSIENERIVIARTLKTHPGRESRERVLIEGERILDWPIERGVIIDFVLLADLPPEQTAEKYSARNIEFFSVSGESSSGSERRAAIRHAGQLSALWGGGRQSLST